MGRWQHGYIKTQNPPAISRLPEDSGASALNLNQSPTFLDSVGGDPIHRALGALGGACDESSYCSNSFYYASLAPLQRGLSFFWLLRLARSGVSAFSPPPSLFVPLPVLVGLRRQRLRKKDFSRRREDSRWARPAFSFPFKVYLAGLALVGNAL
jgi:hypothetical protein